MRGSGLDPQQQQHAQIVCHSLLKAANDGYDVSPLIECGADPMTSGDIVPENCPHCSGPWRLMHAPAHLSMYPVCILCMRYTDVICRTVLGCLLLLAYTSLFFGLETSCTLRKFLCPACAAEPRAMFVVVLRYLKAPSWGTCCLSHSSLARNTTLTQQRQLCLTFAFVLRLARADGWCGGKMEVITCE